MRGVNCSTFSYNNILSISYDKFDTNSCGTLCLRIILRRTCIYHIFFLSRLNLNCTRNCAPMIHEHRLPKVSNSVSKNKYTVTSLHLNKYRNSLTHCSRQCCTKSTYKIYYKKDFCTYLNRSGQAVSVNFRIKLLKC